MFDHIIIEHLQSPPEVEPETPRTCHNCRHMDSARWCVVFEDKVRSPSTPNCPAWEA